MKLPAIPELLRLYSINPTRKLSQNFLKTPKLFIEPIKPSKNSLVFEIGCGPGSITRQLLKRSPKVVAIEVDERFDPILAQLRDYHDVKFKYLIRDVMDKNLSSEVMNTITEPIENIAIVGNLPFAIAGRILSHLNYQSLLSIDYFRYPTTMTLMFAKSVGERLLPTYKKRTQFASITNTAFDVSLNRVFPRTEFVPAPNDDCISLNFKHRGNNLFKNSEELDRYLAFMNQVYKLPNKQCSVSFSKVENSKQMLKNRNIDPKTRMYDIPLLDLVEMSKDY